MLNHTIKVDILVKVVLTVGQQIALKVLDSSKNPGLDAGLEEGVSALKQVNLVSKASMPQQQVVTESLCVVHWVTTCEADQTSATAVHPVAKVVLALQNVVL